MMTTTHGTITKKTLRLLMDGFITYKNMNERETTKNRLGITIVKCCASCSKKVLTGNEKRDCSLGEKNVSATYLCPNWEMSPKLENAGKGGGGVKRKEWFLFLKERGQNRPIKEITEEYEDIHGSKYLTK